MLELEFVVEGSRWEVFVDRPGAWTIGRRRADCAIQIPHSSISRIHATLLVSTQSVSIENHSTTTGMMVNRRALPVAQRAPMRPNDVIQFGGAGVGIVRRASFAPLPDEFEFRLGGWRVRAPFPQLAGTMYKPTTLEHPDRVEIGLDFGPPRQPGYPYGQQRTVLSWEKGWESLEQLLEVQQQHWSRGSVGNPAEIVSCADFSWGHVVRVNTANAGYQPGNTSDYIVLRRCHEIDVFYLNPSLWLTFDWTRLRAWRLLT